MLASLACCSIRVKSIDYRSDGGKGSFPFMQGMSVPISESLMTDPVIGAITTHNDVLAYIIDNELAYVHL